ncbi:right-handed parallel beta-helix repeat-containing protein [Mycoplasma struthionis]|uniref:Right-handed parallel beta-helix repeat-containing protein n=1 Tax=Mycoplasma struthionis TaxID=538220 RepID=A0A3G8LG40_9MOLU|nr:right-handed parallel beta-helix repeat-containing protein [Mycoplasma struthionis]AZG68471.1 right-handed parallel beta-helix repeat-containing protein [Mycoplasma struthionis]
MSYFDLEDLKNLNADLVNKLLNKEVSEEYKTEYNNKLKAIVIKKAKKADWKALIRKLEAESNNINKNQLNKLNEDFSLLKTSLENNEPENIYNTTVNLIEAMALIKDNKAIAAEFKTYYLDSNYQGNGDGLSEKTPFNNLDQINKIKLNPGDKVLLKANSVFKGVLWPKGSGSQENPITISMYGSGNKPIIDAEGRKFLNANKDIKGPMTDFKENNIGAAVYLYNQDYITIENLYLTNPATNQGDRSAIRVEGYNKGVIKGIVIRNNTINHVNGWGTQDDIYTVKAVDKDGNLIKNGANFFGARTTHRTGGINLVTYTAREKEKKNKKGVLVQELDPDKKITIFEDVLIENNDIENVEANGITTTNIKGELDNIAYRHRNVVIRNNKIINATRAGIIPLYTTGVIVDGNVVDTFQSHSSGYGVGIWADRADHMMFINNIVRNGINDKDGMGFNLDDMTKDGLIENNLIINNYGGGIMLHIRDASYNKNHIIRGNILINNTLAFSPNKAQIIAIGEHPLTNTYIKNAKVYNNTFIQEMNGKMIFHGNEVLYKNNIFKYINKDNNLNPN